MARSNYQYTTSPRKLEPNTRQTRQTKRRNLEIVKDVPRQKVKISKEQQKRQTKLTMVVIGIFILLLTISYRNSQINEKFNEIQNKKTELSSIEKTNGQLQVSIEESVNLSSIEQAAKDRLGMKKPDNDQKVYVELEKKDYVETATEEIKEDTKDSNKWYEKILDKIFKK